MSEAIERGRGGGVGILAPKSLSDPAGAPKVERALHRTLRAKKRGPKPRDRDAGRGS